MRLAAAVMLFALGCKTARVPIATLDGGADGAVRCSRDGEQWCDADTLVVCEATAGAFLSRRTSCFADGLVCDATLGCVACGPGARGCDDEGRPAICAPDGSGWFADSACDAAAEAGCVNGTCVDLCAQAAAERSYEGCELYAVDLDNAVDGANDASRQQFAVIVSNPSRAPARVVVEVNDAAPGAPLDLRAIDEAEIAPGALVTFELPRREVDGSTSVGRNDGTHTALTSNAFRVRSNVPVVAYQFNPLENDGLFSADASLLLPTSALGERYTVVAWPQSIGGEPASPGQLRTFVTIVGTRPGTEVTIALGDLASRVAAGGTLPVGRPGDVRTVTLGPFDVLNLETDERGADFSGTVVTATQPIAVFSGAECTDVPFVPEGRVEACDHLEEQLIPDVALGRRFVVARQPARTLAVAAAMIEPDVDVVDEPDYLRIVGADDRDVVVTTTLPAPDDRFTLPPRGVRTVLLSADATIEADGRISILQLVAGQGFVGIPIALPGGDPASIVVPPLEQFRRRTVFLTPRRFAFDFVSIVANADAIVRLDGRTVDERGCESAPIGATRADFVVHRCQLSFPMIGVAPRYELDPGEQGDGVHVVDADSPVGVVVYGFDRFISYAYPGGLDVAPLF